MGVVEPMVSTHRDLTKQNTPHIHVPLEPRCNSKAKQYMNVGCILFGGQSRRELEVPASLCKELRGELFPDLWNETVLEVARAQVKRVYRRRRSLK